MGLATVVALACLLAIVASQGIVYNGLTCVSFGMGATVKNDMKTKYKTMIGNLNKDKTLKAQQTRGTNFLNNNWKNLEGIFDKATLTEYIGRLKTKLEARWRITTYLKNVLAKIKPKLAAAKFTEIKNLLWAKDKAEKNNMFFFYDDWKTAAIAAIPNAAKKTEIQKIIDNQEATYTQIEDDKWAFFPGMGFSNCGLS